MIAINRLAVVVTMSASLVSILGAAADAQTRTTVAPSVAVGVRYDGNVFWSPRPVADLIWGITPAVDATRESAHSTWLSHYSFDTEHYRDQTSLTTPLARQTASTSLKLRPATSTSYTFAGGYDSTQTPSELNMTTGLGTPRLPASRWHGGPEVNRTLDSRTTLRAAYEFTGDFLSTADHILTNAVTVELAHDLGSRDRARAVVTVERFAFNGHAAIRSATFVGGWARHLTPFTTLSVAAGPRVGAGSIRPELSAALGRKAGASELSLAYDRTQTTAFGLLTLVDVQRLLATAAYRRPGTLEASLQGGFYDNQVAATRVRVYRVAAGLTKPIVSTVSISAVYTLDVQRGRIRPDLPETLVTTPAGIDLVPLTSGGRLRRHVVMLRLVIAPEFKRVTEPPKPPAGDGRTNRSLP